MHWANKIAQELVEKYPHQESFVCASGISPSGSVHIGNFREVITSYFVVKALEDLGKKTRFIFSWDDYDRFRKVPKNVDSSFEKYIGMPYCEVPDPYGCHQSYAEHFEREFESALDVFGIDVEFIYQGKEYTSGRYNRYILQALEKRGEIYDILMMFKTQEYSKEERRKFYPITIYCEKCRRDSTEVQEFDLLNNEIRYTCTCGKFGVVNIMEARNIKLNWKIDWPMRWMVEGVIFEPGGRDHSSETGSFNVSKEISSRIFNYNPPKYAAYEFIGIKGSNGKMSSSMGNIITPNELLNIYIPEIILFIFSKYRPSASFNIGLDEDVIRNYTEFERYYEGYIHDLLEDEDIKYSMKLSQVKRDRNLPRFSTIASILPLINFNSDLLMDILNNIHENHKPIDVMEISKRVEYWIKNWYPDKLVSINTERDYEYYIQLNDQEKKWLKDLCIFIMDSEDLSNDQIMKGVYEIVHDDDIKVRKNNQKRLFYIVYRLVLNNNSGARLSILIKALGVKKILSLLDFDFNQQNI